MKLFAVVVFGFIAIVGSEAYSKYRSTYNQDEGYVQGYTPSERYGQQNSNSGFSQDQEQGSQGLKHQHNYNWDNSNERSWNKNNNQQNNQGMNDEYSESNWNVQSGRHHHNRNSQNKQYNAKNSQEYGSMNQQNSEEQYQSKFNKNSHKNQDSGLFSDLSSGSSSSSESNSQEDYIKEQIGGDVSNEIGRNVAQKMVKFFNIVEKYAAHNGTVQSKQAQEPLPLRQWALPMDHHQFLNMNDGKVNSLSQGIIKSMFISTEKNSVNLEYLFNHLLVKGNLKASTGPRGPFNLVMINTKVNVSTDLENHNSNRNYAYSSNGKAEFNPLHSIGSSDSQLITDNVESKYVQFINRAIENEMIDNSYNGMVGCLRSEIESALDVPTTKNRLDMVIQNKKTQLTVSLVKTQVWNSDQSNKHKKVQYVAFRQNKYGNGYKLKVKIVLAKQPTWESDVIAQKSHEEIKIKNVNFRAQNIVATAVMERVQQHNGAYKFNVEDASIKIEGLKFDIGKFDLDDSTNDKLAREVGQNLEKILENGMSAALQQQLYQQQQICQQSPMDCVRCNQYNQQ